MTNLSAKQARGVLEGQRRWNLFIGATRSGKSYTQQLLIPVRVQERIPGLYMLVAKTQGNVESNILSPMRELYGEEFVGRPGLRHGVSRVKIFGKEFFILGGDNLRAVDKLRGKTVGYCAGDEGPTWPDALMQMLKTRLTDPRAKADITGNPEGPRHPFKVDLINRADELGVFHLAYGLDDNPILSEEIKAQLRRELQGVWYQRLILGRWVAAEGAIYDAFDETRHVIDVEPEPRLLRREFVACDYGTGNPTVFLRLAEGMDERWYVLEEYCWDAGKMQRQKTDAEYMADLQRFLAGHHPQGIFIDPSAASFLLACRRAGLTVTQAEHAVVDGIRYVASLLAANRLFIHRRCATLLGELPGYVWDARAAEHGEDLPVKVNDHACDALRYGLYTPYAPNKGGGRAVLPVNLQSRFRR